MTSSSDECDLLVVGGGPAGSTAGTFVARAGHKVVLLERETFPRHQIGESLLPATIHGVCKLLGVFDELASANFVVKRGGQFRWGRRDAPWDFNFQHHQMLEDCAADFAYQVERSRFDEILLRNAGRNGVDIREGWQVTTVVTEGERVVGVRCKDKDANEREIRARYVVDASGHGSVLASTVGARQHSEFFRNMAIYTYFENGKRNPPPLSGNITCAAFDKGWFWYIPLSDTLTSVGAVIGNEFVNELKKKDHSVVFAELLDQCSLIKDFLSPAKRVAEGIYAPVRIRKDWSYTTARFWKPGLVLVGDAACFIDPVFSSGVHLATYSAMLAARSINTCLKGTIDEQPCFDEFEARYRREFRVFYEFLLRFYDMHQDEDSYFWSARKILGTSEVSNAAFIRLVAGAGTTAEEFFRGKTEWISKELRERRASPIYEKDPALMALRASGKAVVEEAFKGSTAEDRVVTAALTTSADGQTWEIPKMPWKPSYVASPGCPSM